MSVTPVCCWIQVLCLWLRRVMPSIILSIFLCATASASIWAVVKAQVSLPYVITGSTYSLNTFFLICMLALRLLMMLSTLLKAAHPKVICLLISGIRSPSLATFPVINGDVQLTGNHSWISAVGSVSWSSSKDSYMGMACHWWQVTAKQIFVPMCNQAEPSQLGTGKTKVQPCSWWPACPNFISFLAVQKSHTLVRT